MPCIFRWVSVPAYRPVLVFESWAPEPEAMEAAVEWALGQQAQGRDVFCHCTHVSGVWGSPTRGAQVMGKHHAHSQRW